MTARTGSAGSKGFNARESGRGRGGIRGFDGAVPAINGGPKGAHARTQRERKGAGRAAGVERGAATSAGFRGDERESGVASAENGGPGRKRRTEGGRNPRGKKGAQCAGRLTSGSHPSAGARGGEEAGCAWGGWAGETGQRRLRREKRKLGRGDSAQSR